MFVDLNLCNCTNLSDYSFGKLAEGCSLLEILDLSSLNYGSILEANFALFGEKCPRQSNVNLSDTQVCDDCIVELTEGCSKLEILDLSCNEVIGDASLIALSEKCPKLKILDVSCNCGDISDLSVNKILQGCPYLILVGHDIFDDEYEYPEGLGFDGNSFRNELISDDRCNGYKNCCIDVKDGNDNDGTIDMKKEEDRIAIDKGKEEQDEASAEGGGAQGNNGHIDIKDGNDNAKNSQESTSSKDRCKRNKRGNPILKMMIQWTMLWM